MTNRCGNCVLDAGVDRAVEFLLPTAVVTARGVDFSVDDMKEKKYLEYLNGL